MKLDLPCEKPPKSQSSSISRIACFRHCFPHHLPESSYPLITSSPCYWGHHSRVPSRLHTQSHPWEGIRVERIRFKEAAVNHRVNGFVTQSSIAMQGAIYSGRLGFQLLMADVKSEVIFGKDDGEVTKAEPQQNKRAN
jgi:hypothetical protein